ncbi:MAG: hypothetical protein COB98_00560 [Flavobacteriaceae bacterium]|nr:MAG: hypothetical protein COB98_00560 [Flavobacteriaceae bacterium]
MKKIKNIYRLLLLLPLITVVSCDDAEDYNDVLTKGTTTKENTVFIVTDNLYETISLVGIGNEIEIFTGINNAMSTDTNVELLVMKNGSPAELEKDYDVENGLIKKGELEGKSIVTFLKSGSFDVSVKKASASSLIVVNNRLRHFVPENVTIRIDWEDSFYDYGLIIFDKMAELSDIYSNGVPEGIKLIGYSDGVSNSEIVNMSPPVGDSFVYIEDYWNDNADIPVTFTLEEIGKPSKTIDLIVEEDKWVVKITTEFDGVDKVTYAISKI